ncbi:MAG: hypothetical protein ARM1_0623 [Candidatus Micrarchaeota archaeon]|nr:MAG: hypothetical protein ARM1_0623 [Candidatus Micrarchaeota archaeon]
MVDKQVSINAFDINAVSSIVKRLDINIIEVLNYYLKGASITYKETTDEASISIHKIKSRSKEQQERSKTIILSLYKRRLIASSKFTAMYICDEEYIKSTVNKEDADTYRKIFDIYFLYNYV